MIFGFLQLVFASGSFIEEQAFENWAGSVQHKEAGSSVPAVSLWRSLSSTWGMQAPFKNARNASVGHVMELGAS